MIVYIVFRVTDNRDFGGKIVVGHAVFKSLQTAQLYADSLSKNDGAYHAIVSSLVLE